MISKDNFSYEIKNENEKQILVITIKGLTHDQYKRIIIGMESVFMNPKIVKMMMG